MIRYGVLSEKPWPLLFYALGYTGFLVVGYVPGISFSLSHRFVWSYTEMVRITKITLLLFCFGLSASVYAASALPGKGFDLLVLLDDSGSMRKTDRGNKRSEAMEMFLRLCRPEHRVGVFGFSGGAQELGGLASMGKGGARDRMIKSLKRIESRGEWTDIEQALRKALDEQVRVGDRKKPRAVLLMTDGQVDNGKGSVANAESIRRIRGELLTEYLQEDVTLYCVAFSSGADRELLQYLAESTRGLCVSGESQDELQRLFARLFSEMAQPQTLPVDDSKVRFDNYVRESSFLILHDSDQSVTLTLPNGKVISYKDAGGEIDWFTASEYDLITVGSPAAGVWSISPAGKTGDEQVIVLTDMEMKIGAFETLLTPGQSLSLTVSLENDGKTVQQPEIVAGMVVKGKFSGPEQMEFTLLDDGVNSDGYEADGLFGRTLTVPTQPGAYDLEIVVRARTFERRIVRSINVVERWFSLSTEDDVVRPGSSIPIKTIIRNDSVASDEDGRIRFIALVQKPDGVRKSIELDPVTDFIHSTVFDATDMEGKYQVTVTGTYQGANGKVFHDTVGPLIIPVKRRGGSIFPSSGMALPVSPIPDPIPIAEPTAASFTKKQVIMMFAGGGLLLVLLTALATWLILRSRQPASAVDESMERLRRRASEIRDEEYEVVKPVMAAVAASVPEPDPEPEPEPDPDPEPVPEPDSETEPIDQPVEPLGEGVEIITLPDEPDIVPLGSEVLVEKEAVDALGGLSDNESQLLAEIMGDVAPEPSAPVPTPAPEPVSAEIDQDALLAEILGETEDLFAQADATAEGSAPESAGGGTVLSEDESSLIAEIMADDVGGAKSVPAPESVAVPADQTAGLDDEESRLLAEIMAESGSSIIDETPAAAPAPEQEKPKSDQDVIDDILKDIEGLMG